jgi:hypothetical protein
MVRAHVRATEAPREASTVTGARDYAGQIINVPVSGD